MNKLPIFSNAEIDCYLRRQFGAHQNDAQSLNLTSPEYVLLGSLIKGAAEIAALVGESHVANLLMSIHGDIFHF